MINGVSELGEEDISLMADLNVQGKRMLEDAVLKRNVCVRKVLIEKHLPKYMGEEVAVEYEDDFLVNMGMIFLVNKIITNGVSIHKSEKKNEKVSSLDIAEFTVEKWLDRIKSKWKTQKKR